jgi:hypothetical protein
MTIRSLFIALPLVFAAACSDDDGSQPKDAAQQADAGPPDASCFDLTNVQNPTHEQIINACTDPAVQKLFKDSHPPRMNADGTLPALPP